MVTLNVYINRNELKALLKDLCIPMSSDKEMDNLFKELDPDGEGFVTFDNFYGCALPILFTCYPLLTLLLFHLYSCPMFIIIANIYCSQHRV